MIMQWSSNKRWSDGWTQIEAIEGGGQASAKRVKRMSGDQEAFLKILSRNRDPERRARFFREATAYSLFKHPGIPRLIESNAHLHADPDYALYIATEWIDGPTLRGFIDRHGPVELAVGVALISSVLGSLRLCHQQDVVHRDIKPDNVILLHGDPSQPVLLDFGLTHHEEADGEVPFQTEHGQEIGNRFLRLPELSANSPLKQDSRSDLTFTAGLLFYVLTGLHPDVLTDAEGRLPHQRQGAYDRLRRIAGDNLARLMNFFDRAFAIRLGDRFSTADEMTRAAQDIMQAGGAAAMDVAGLRAMLDTDAARRRKEAVERFSYVLRFIQNLHDPFIDELGGTLDMFQTGWEVDGASGRNTLGFKKKGDPNELLKNTFVVQQAGDELTVVAAGEPLLRLAADPLKLDQAAYDTVRAFLVRRLAAAMNDADPLPAEAERLETKVHASLEAARGQALETGRAIYAIYYDEREKGRGELDYGLTQYFGTRKARALLAEHFVVAMVPVSSAAAVAPALGGRSMEKARWAIFSGDLELLENGVLDRNANDGERMIESLVDRFGRPAASGQP